MVIEVPEVLVEPLVKVRLVRLAVAAAAGARDTLEKVLILPVAVVEVTDEVPKPVSAIEPEVAVSDRAPVVSVKPFEPVNKPAEVTVPVPEAEILPEVVMASPALDGARELPVLVHQPS